MRLRVFTDLTVVPGPSENLDDTFEDISERVRAALLEIGIVHTTQVEMVDPVVPHMAKAAAEATDDILADAFEMGNNRGRGRY
jgi:hypothetical protein